MPPVFGESVMGRLTVTRDHCTHRWVVRKGGDWVEDYPEFCQPLAFAHAFRLAVQDGLGIEEIR